MLPAGRLPALLEALTDQPVENGPQALAAVRALAVPPPQAALVERLAFIDRHFGAPSLQAIADTVELHILVDLSGAVCAGLGAAISALEGTSGRQCIWATGQYLSYAKRDEILDIDVTIAVEGHQITQARAVGHVGTREILTVNAALGLRRQRSTRRERQSPDGLAAACTDTRPSGPVRHCAAPPDDQAERSETMQLIERAIGRLPAKYRYAFVLADVEGLANAEVGDLLGLSLPAVKSRLHRARALPRHPAPEGDRDGRRPGGARQ